MKVTTEEHGKDDSGEVSNLGVIVTLTTLGSKAACFYDSDCSLSGDDDNVA